MPGFWQAICFGVEEQPVMYNIAVHTNVIVRDFIANNLVVDNVVANNRNIYLYFMYSDTCILIVISVLFFLVSVFILCPFVRYSIPLR